MANLSKYQIRKSTIYLTFITGCITVLAFLLWVHPYFKAQYFEKSLTQKKQLVQKLGLTDLCLFTEARYTRHLSQADVFSAFQDSMGALEHFPAGVLASPPASIVERGEDNQPTS